LLANPTVPDKSRDLPCIEEVWSPNNLGLVTKGKERCALTQKAKPA
jgi:hypothetical protein